MNVLDAFSGAGGWCLAARTLGVDPLGIELADAVCATRRAAGLRTLQADVAALDPVALGSSWPSGVTGLIASPPCQAFSAAGKRDGERDLPLVWQAIRDLAAGRDTRHEHHLTSVAWCALCLMELEQTRPEHDDRPARQRERMEERP